ncbi:MAG: mechanosensitive ion channel family protein [Desulfobacteraceae bacterium]|nr:mechanosensitive ion channel family protein [Desulfobacteraceae bacterium]
MSIVRYLESFPILSERLLLQQLTVIVIYSLIAKTGDLFIDRILRRIAARTRIRFDDQIIDITHRPLCWTVLLLGMLHALAMRTMPPPYQTVLPAAIKSAILLLWLVAAVRIFNYLAAAYLSRIVERGKIGRDLFLLLKNVIRVVLVAAGLLWVLSVWDVNLTPLFASAGIAGIAVALAAKDTLANFFGGISIFADDAFKVGDYIILDSAERGEVAEIGIRSTRITTRDGVLITIPNSIIANSKIINESAPIPRFRLRIPVGVAYGSDLDQVEAVLLAVARANPQVVAEPEPRVRYRSFADSSINLELLVWIEDPARKGLETHHLIKAISSAFNQHGITIPFPQQDVHLDHLPAHPPGETMLGGRGIDN